MRRRLGAEEAMQNPEVCRSQAVKCMLLAREANDFPYKLMLLSIAQLWRGIAETSEEVDTLRKPQAAIGIVAR
jgi:hypothetical protein